MSPELLPPIHEMRRIAQSLAMLDAILSQEWEYRYYSFNGNWGPGEEMASMRNGSGDDWFLLFGSPGAALKGFAHELATGSSIADAIQRDVPRVFSSFLGEPAFSMQQATFCYWREAADPCWSKVCGTGDYDGSDDMIAQLLGDPSAYRDWAEEYFEVSVDAGSVSAVFAHAPLSDSLIRALNPEAILDKVYSDAAEIGYPRNAA